MRSVIFLLISVELILCCGCERSTDRKLTAQPMQQVDYQQHLRLGIEQMRRRLYPSAAAELEKCRQIAPDDPELLFQSARLRLAQDNDVNQAVKLLNRALENDDRMVKAHRLLYVIRRAQHHPAQAAAHRADVERLYGALGALEMEATDYYLAIRQTPPDYLQVPASLQDANGARARFAKAAAKLQRHGYYDPGEAVPALEALLREYPHLTALRLYYAETLLTFDVRIQNTERDDLPPINSRLITDYAQIHFEHTADQCDPRLLVAARANYWLAEAGMRMGDYDEAVMYLDLLINDKILADSGRRRYMMRKGVARYKQGRCDEAITTMTESRRGAPPPTQVNLPELWNLHLAYEAAGVPIAEREFPFRFRPDLLLAGREPPIRFKDMAAELGVNKFDGAGPSAWCDYDHDGDLDLFTCGCDSYGALYRNDADRFRDVTVEAGLFHMQSGMSATFADYDNDGWCDLYIGRDGWISQAPNSLYRNKGDGSFVEVTARAGVGHPGSSFVHAWLDCDRDGFLDLFVANGIVGGGDTNVLYHNNGDGTFTDATASAGMGEPRGVKTIGFAIGDYDKDGWPDIFVGGYNWRHRLYHNRGDGTFEEVALRAGLRVPQWETLRYVSFFFDYDNDTYPDILATCVAPWPLVLRGMSADYETLSEDGRERLFRGAPKLYRNNRDGTFTNVSRQAGFLYPVGNMGGNVADLDNDGFQDIYFGTGDPDVARMEPNRFYRNNGDGTFTDWTFPSGLGNLGKGHGVTFMDLDFDGDLDVYVPVGGATHGDRWENAFYLNLQDTGNSWLHIDLQGDPSNRDAVGASVTLTAGEMTQLREVKGGRGFGSFDSPTVEFGLGKATIVRRMEIRWPSGTHQVFKEVPVNQRIFVREGQAWRPWQVPGSVGKSSG